MKHNVHMFCCNELHSIGKYLPQQEHNFVLYRSVHMTFQKFTHLIGGFSYCQTLLLQSSPDLKIALLYPKICFK